MTTKNVARVGGIVSADIAVPEHERELRFYAEVLTTGERPLWRDDLTNRNGTPIIGLGTQSAEWKDLPVQWMPHIQVSDVAASAARAVELGARELARDSNGQWAVLSDPNGAAFGLIPVVPDGPPPAAGDGTLAWVDLTVADAERTRDFYRRVVGWTSEDCAMGDYADYTMLAADGLPAAGVCHARGPNAGLPPVWMLYLPVGDIDESLRRVAALGGTVLKQTIDGNNNCTCAAIRDPIGVCLSLVPAPASYVVPGS